MINPNDVYLFVTAGCVYVFLEELPHQVKFQETVGAVIGTQLNISPPNPMNRPNLSSHTQTTNTMRYFFHLLSLSLFFPPFVVVLRDIKVEARRLTDVLCDLLPLKNLYGPSY